MIVKKTTFEKLYEVMVKAELTISCNMSVGGTYFRKTFINFVIGKSFSVICSYISDLIVNYFGVLSS